MPELPEVETIKTQLQEKLPLKITKVSYSPVVKSILKPQNVGFSPKGHHILKMDRQGKMLIFEMSKDKFILSHLGMSGSWRISSTIITQKHTHVQLEGKTEEGEKIFLAYIDPRRFGNMYFVDQTGKEKQMSKLGVDIGRSEFNTNYLKKIFTQFPNKIIKPFLLDQKYFAGCGNYIASEICALSGILPTRACKDIRPREYKKIIEATQAIIQGQIQNNGLTFSGGYQDAYGEKGQGVMNLMVFHQEICGICKKNEVVKITMQQRGTFYCPKCQK